MAVTDRYGRRHRKRGGGVVRSDVTGHSQFWPHGHVHFPAQTLHIIVCVCVCVSIYIIYI